MQIASPGTWKSPITSELIVSDSIGLGAVVLDGEDIYWLESRPTEKGRNVLVRYTKDGTITDITPPPFNVISRVHEFGGGAFLVSEGNIYFSNFLDQQVYQQTLDSPPQKITNTPNCRFADYILDKQRNRLICVCEEEQEEGNEPKNTIVSIDLVSFEITTLVSGDDFYSSPRLNPKGDKLAFISWNHPNMPWDGTELWVANLKLDGLIAKKELIAGGKQESICQPEWSHEGILYFASDKTDWWNLYKQTPLGKIEAIYPMEAEFGYPHWVFGESLYGLAKENKIFAAYTENGRWYLASIKPDNKELQIVNLDYTEIHSLNVEGDQLVFLAGSPQQATAVVKLNLEPASENILKRSLDLTIDPGYISIPEDIAFKSGNHTAYAWFYPPQNKDYTSTELPPLLVKSHGGPTDATSASFNLKIQYWTSRGFAVLDVNYGGSTGYGRKYRQRLEKNWGVVDVDDCVNGAKYLVEQGKVAKDKLCIAGGSAGGYTTLAALTFRDTFKVGASYYGISDLEALAKDTHKFEARYLDRLIGQYPQEKQLYQERSPINYSDRLNCPVIFFQGLEDKVVPPNQAEMMVKVLKEKGIPVAYLTFEGEGHGFRISENIKRTIDGQYYFFCRIFGLETPSEIEPVEIFNLGT